MMCALNESVVMMCTFNERVGCCPSDVGAMVTSVIILSLRPVRPMRPDAQDRKCIFRDVSYAIPGNQFLHSPVTLGPWQYCFLFYPVLREVVLATPCLETMSCTHQ